MDIYVGNLPYDTDEAFVRETFEQFGTVDNVKIVIDYDTGRSKGFAFVKMDDAEQAKTAIAELNGADLNGRAIKVNEARPREDKPRGGGGGGGSRSFKPRGGGGFNNDRRGGGGGGGYKPRGEGGGGRDRRDRRGDY